MERNPYLLLGLPFGASRDEAQVAFARRARPLKRQGEAGRAMLLELTAALNEIDTVISDPSTAIDVYRIPADTDAFESGEPGMFTPPPEQLGRRQSSSEKALLTLLGQAAHELLIAVIVSAGEAVELPEF